MKKFNFSLSQKALIGIIIVLLPIIITSEIDKLLSAYFKTSFTGKNPGKGERCAELIMASHRYSKNEIEKR